MTPTLKRSGAPSVSRLGRITAFAIRFASYHLAKHQNAPQLALEMGHSTPRMIFDNYREVVAPAEAERYWTIRPTVIAALNSERDKSWIENGNS